MNAIGRDRFVVGKNSGCANIMIRRILQSQDFILKMIIIHIALSNANIYEFLDILIKNLKNFLNGSCKDDCYFQACKNFYNEGMCVNECPKPKIYNRVTMLLEDNPDGKYAYKSLCVKECPGT
jgi:hypothetical protein